MSPVSPRWPEIPRLAGLALLYALLAKLALSHFSANGVVSIVWPSSGLALAALLIGGKRYWPGIFVGALAGNLLAGNAAAMSFFIAGGNTLAALVGIQLLARQADFDATLTKPRCFWQLGLAGAASAGVGAAAGATTLLAFRFIDSPTLTANFVQWWQGDLLGVVLVTPLLLIWQRAPRAWFERDRIIETALFLLLTFLCGQAVFLGWFHDAIGPIALGYWTFVFVAWGAVRFGRHGALLVIGMTAVQALTGAVTGVGFFAHDIARTGLENFWFYMLVLTLVGISLASVMAARARAEDEIRRVNTAYATLSETNQIIVRLHSAEELYPSICQIAVVFGGYSGAWVGLADAASERIIPAASAGTIDDYIRQVEVSTDAGLPAGRGPTAHAWRNGRPYFCQDFRADPATTPWHDFAHRFGIRASAALPLLRGGVVVGVLTLYANETNYFDARMQTLLEEMANDVSFALDNFDREAARAKAEAEVLKLNQELEHRVDVRTADLAAANRNLEAFSYSVSHDLRAPLRAINGFAGLLLENERAHLTADGQHMLDRIAHNAVRLGELIDAILEYSRAGRMTPGAEDIDLAALAQKTAAELRESYPDTTIRVGSLPRVRGDATMLRQILGNLLGNACKYSAKQEHPVVEIAVHADEARTVYCVKDNGVGFDMRYAGKLFGMFQRLHNEADFQGSGVGLAIVKRLVERHGGTVWAESAPGAGAAFYFTLGTPA